jgi:hypothetical protein
VSGIPAWLRYVAISGNVVFILWVVRNGLESGFRGTPAEVASFVGLVALLTLNTGLLLARRSRNG